MTSFVNPGLLWGLLILAVPILIHLINLMRHRRVQWAAMEFLLVSRRKNSTWIRLKELLLLALRVAIIAAIVLLLAQPLLQNQWGRLFGAVKTHQIVLLDDSFSMSDRWANTSAFDEAKHVVGRIAEQAARQSTPQTFTLLRYSQATRGSGNRFDLLQERVDTRFAQELASRVQRLQSSQEAVGIGPALVAVEQLLPELTGEDVVVHVVSDFRARDWQDPGEVADSLARVSQAAAKTYLVNCVDTSRPNLSIVSIRPLDGTQAAGVPVPMEATVHNFGSTPVDNVAVMLSEDGRERPAITIDQVGAGQSETRRFEVFFPTAGVHQVTARLASDSVAADNVRYCLVDLPLAVPVLIIDGDPTNRNAKFLSTVFAPGGAAHTGLQPQIERPDFLNKHALEKFRAIYLADVDRLDAPGVTALEKYVQAGGGVMFFVGEHTQAKFYNDQLYRDGEGLFPVPLVRDTQLLVDRLQKAADIEPVDQGILGIFAGERNSYLAGVTVERYFLVPKGWSPAPDSGTEIVARLRNNDPVTIEHKFGKGRVVAMLTTAAPLWNNWGRNPSFVVALLELQSYLAQTNATQESRLVGVPITIDFDAALYQPRVRFTPPEGLDATPLTVDATNTPRGLSASLADALTSGVYQAELSTVDEKPEVRLFAVNVQADEGDLAVISRDALASRLPEVRYEYRSAEDVQVSAQQLAGSNLSDWILYLLIGILIGEQLLAYSASYHPKASREVR
jgi:hypothetical protein